MKKILYLWIMILVLCGCQQKQDVEETMRVFLIDYYEVTQEQVDAYRSYMINVPDDVTSDRASLEAYYDRASQLFDICHIQKECHEKFTNQYFNAAMYQRYPSLLTNNQASRIEVKESEFELDTEYDDFAYYLHHTNIDVSYDDGTVKTYQVEGRICIEQTSKLIYSYQVTKDIAFENNDPIDHRPKDTTL